MEAWATTRRNKDPDRTMVKVAIDKSRSRSEVLSGKARDEMAEKKAALKPNAARGKAVAVPRWFGQFSAAILNETEITIEYFPNSYMS